MANSADGFPAYVCTLSPELKEKAKKELGEKEKWRSRDIQALRDMILKNPQLKIRTDDAYLLRFLRAKKFDYERAYNLILSHFKMKIEHKDVFVNFRPSAVKHVLKAGVTGVLPERDLEGRRVIVLRPGKWNPESFSIDDVFRTNFMTFSKLIQEEETQVNGIILLIDLTGVGLTHVRHISPFYAKRIMSLLQDAFPARVKGIHYLHEPSIFDAVFAIVKQFMKKKTVERLHFHGSNIEELANFINPKYLPEEYGGEKPPYSNEDWAEILLKCDDEFDKEAKYGLLDMTQTTSSGVDAMDCVVGSYRKRDV